jgi:hypothetical protein
MENVIIGRLIPAGTGFAKSPKYEMIKRLREERSLLEQQARAEMQKELEHVDAAR